MQIFTINKGATLPYLEVEPIANGRERFDALYDAIESATVTFSMTDTSTGVKRIANAPCRIIDCSYGCERRFVIRYPWKARDTKEPGRYKGQFKISLSGDVISASGEIPTGDLIVPIESELIIHIV